VLDDSNKPFFQWFVGGKVNIVTNCLDRHVDTWRRNKLALIWEGEKGETRSFSYHTLNREVCMFANVLRSMGVRKGDRVTIYMGRIPELPIAMLACAKVGAVHSVVYGGFSVEALHGRIEDSQSNVVITCDGGYMNGKIVELKQICDEAIKRAGSVEHVIVVKRTGHEIAMEAGRDYWYHDLMALPVARTATGNTRCETEVMDAEDPLFMLYTSGTTGKPKAIVHTHGGYMVGVGTTLKYVFDIKDEDRYWCTADPGWITGHSYIVYGPLLLGATSFMYEGAPTYPYPNRWWAMIERYGINILYTAPTAIRGLMRFGEAWPNRHDLSSLRCWAAWANRSTRSLALVSPRDRQRALPDHGYLVADRDRHVHHHPACPKPLRPGSATLPFPGIEADVVDEHGNPVAPGEEGYLVLKQPWPAMLRTIYNDPDRYVQQYWSRYPGVYFTGDSARKGEDGYFWIIGRVDDVIKVSGYRLGTAEIESALVSHPSVAEAARLGCRTRSKATPSTPMSSCAPGSRLLRA
jgi:acetyl-CoA synthetase